MIVYAPIIADTIPAFTSTLVIPFTQHLAVDINNVTGFCLIIKDYLTSDEIKRLIVPKSSSNLNFDNPTQSGKITFNLEISNTFPQATQYYKFQLAYTDKQGTLVNDDFYAFSNVSIGRYIGSTPSISIKNLTTTTNNIDKGIYEGQYNSPYSKTEPIYSYRFWLQEQGKSYILQDTGEVLYLNGSQGNPTFKLNYELKDGIIYLLTFSITTVNGYQGNSSSYSIIENNNENVPVCSLSVSQQEPARRGGYVNIALSSTQSCKGDYLIERTSDDQYWEELLYVTVDSDENINNYQWRDYSVEQGVTYKYAIREKINTNNSYGARNKSSTINIDFENNFLTDGNRQLNLNLNSTVSSFKDTVLEQKTDTIGSQYPFFFRNGNVNYKEIGINGLITYILNEDKIFMQDSEFSLSSSQLDDYIPGVVNALNTTIERQFRDKVLSWLNDGQPKLLRSPTMGNYVVRLMNVALQPFNSTSGMLWTFSATGYQISDKDLESLRKKKIIKFKYGSFTSASTLGYFILGENTLG